MTTEDLSEQPRVEEPLEWPEIATLLDGMHKMWANYISFYVVFFTANLGALSWYFGTEAGHIRLADRRALCLMWIFFNILSIISTLTLGQYSHRLRGHVDALMDGKRLQHAKRAAFMAPGSMVRAAAWTNASGLTVFALLWLWLLLER